MIPIQIGDTVLYSLSVDDAKNINRRYDHAAANRETFKEHQWGYQVHLGSKVYPGEVLPMTITQIWPDYTVNGKVILDGTDSLWVTIVQAGEDHNKPTPGRWHPRPHRFLQ